VVQNGSKMASITIAKCLKKNGILLMALDQDIRVNSVFVDFFGRKASTTGNIALFSQKYNSPVVSAFSTRLEDGTHQFYFENLSTSSNPNEDDGILNLTQLYSSKLEDHIRKNPSQWVWNHRRWKTQPDEDKSS
jgi:Kdo2-lipid IVA lauroyltransferase/acyltransferase